MERWTGIEFVVEVRLGSLLEGETLRARLMRVPILWRKAAEIALAEGWPRLTPRASCTGT